MSRFDRILILDWSARSALSPVRPVADAIYLCEAPEGAPIYLRGRAAAMAELDRRIGEALARGQRLLIGFDFAFGYPPGFARQLTGEDRALAVWDWLSRRIVDGPDNANNRWAVAAEINAAFAGLGPLWGCPPGVALPDLPARGTLRHGHGIPEHRATERRAPGSQSVLKLFTTGSVGSQSLLGLPHLARLRARRGAALQVWPQETGFALPEAPVVLAEIWPGLTAEALPARAGSLGAIKDARQVAGLADHLAALDRAGRLEAAFGPPRDLPDPDRIAREEGWILLAP